MHVKLYDSSKYERVYTYLTCKAARYVREKDLVTMKTPHASNAKSYCVSTHPNGRVKNCKQIKN